GRRAGAAPFAKRSKRASCAAFQNAVRRTRSRIMAWTIEDSRELYNLDGWGIGYFDINEKGHVTVHPTREPERGLDLFELATDLEAQGVGLPLLLRFSDILRTRIESLTERFHAAIEEFGYEGTYTTVYPIKVNQQRH